MTPPPPRDRDDFEIAIICALTKEANAVQELFDLFWEDEDQEDYGQADGDNNSYTTGVIGKHNVVLAHMPGMGAVDAAIVAGGLKLSFRNIKLAMVVGICGGVPAGNGENDVYLGDLVISTSVVQYDFGRQYPRGLKRKSSVEDSLGRPNMKIRGVLAKLRTDRYYEKLITNITTNLNSLRNKRAKYRHPGVEQDCLYEPQYVHKHRPMFQECGNCEEGPEEICGDASSETCDQLHCDRTKLVKRQRLPRHQNWPNIHFGRVGSGNGIIKAGTYRDQVAMEDNLVAFEMEGVGVWDTFPTIVIKAVCDYADSHKNKIWQEYAAAVAAAGAKGLLSQWAPTQRVETTDRVSSTIPPPQNPNNDGYPGGWVIFNNKGSVGTQIHTQNITGDQNITHYL